MDVIIPGKTVKLTESEDSHTVTINISPYGSNWDVHTEDTSGAHVYFDQETLVGSFLCKVSEHIFVVCRRNWFYDIWLKPTMFPVVH